MPIWVQNLIPWAMGITMVAVLLYFINRRDKRQAEESRKKGEAERLATLVRRAVDNQYNVGNRVFNALTKTLVRYTALGFRAVKFPENGSYYSIHVNRYHEYTVQGSDPIIQISFHYADFVQGKTPLPVSAHWGAYGITMWCQGDDTTVNQLMSRVMTEVHQESLRLTKVAT